MNNLPAINFWEIYYIANGDAIIRYLEHFGGGYKNEKVLRIDFENRLIETVKGYYKLGEHR